MNAREGAPTGQPTLYTVPPNVSFVDALASGLLAGRALPLDPGDPLALSRLTILLPTRRACRALRLAFLRTAPGRALLLPRIRPLGDIDEDEPSLGDEADEALPDAISPLERRLLLARLILKLGETAGGAALTGAGTADQASRLARALAALLDEIQIARLDAQGLAALAPEEYAAHWQQVLRFLSLITDSWPQILAERGLMDPAARRNALLERLAKNWEAEPPAHPVIAAGSTGSVPATRDLLAVIARLPQGAVVLPGLDTDADDETWEAIGPTHPQFALRGLLARIGVARTAVLLWPGDEGAGAPRPRPRLIADAMRPAETITAWRALPPSAPESLRDIHRIDCANPQEEAGVIAVIMRRTLETPGRTAALVAADRALARRVAAELKRWRIEVDDSAGEPLGETAPGAYLRLTARMIAEDAAPVTLLAALKHPLAAGGDAPAAFRRAVRAMEGAILRGPRPAPGFRGLKAALSDGDAAIRSWLEGLEAAAAPFAALLAQPDARAGDLVDAHVGFAEWLATTDAEDGAARLWAGEAGAQAARFVSGLLDAASALPPVAPPAQYPALLDALMEDHVVRPPFGRHPRLQIWGPLEARLQHADCMILGGLNEGVWPPAAAGDPWMSRPMRAAVGLPPPELRIGLSAHDFVQCCGAQEVYLTRARRVDGTPTIPSRWLQRLDALLAVGNGREAAALRAMEPALLAWWQALDDPADAPGPCPPPAPTPPVAVRPRRLSVTRVETWITDPYSLYARDILRLKPLDPVDADPSAAERGSIIHRILDAFVREYPDALPPDAEARLLALGREQFEAAGVPPGVLAFWWPRFRRIAGWFLETERARRPALQPLATEVEGALDLEAPGGSFRLTAKADRIDRTDAGGLEIIDYKTGGIPSQRDVTCGRRPQLSLEAAIAAAGGFEGVAAAEIAALAYWKLSGAETAGEITRIGGDMDALAQEAAAGLQALVARFDDPATPYHPVPRPALAPRWNDYAHLARHKEWSVPGGEP